MAKGRSGAIWWAKIIEKSGNRCVWQLISPKEVYGLGHDTPVLEYEGACDADKPAGIVTNILNAGLATTARSDLWELI